MKKLLSTLLLAAAVPATMLAKPYQADNMSVKAKAIPAPVKQATFLKADQKVNPALLMEIQGNTLLSDTVPSFGYYGMYYSTGYMGDYSVIQYDAATDAVYVLNNRYRFKLKGNDETVETKGYIDILVYPNGGMQYGEKIRVFDKKDTVAWYPSFDVVNPNGVTDPKKLNFLVASEDIRNVNPTNNNFIFYNKSAFTMYNGAPTTPLTKSVYENGPEDSPVYGWRDLKPHGFIAADEKVPYYIMGAPLFATTESGQKHGPYGMAIYKNAEVQEQLSSQFPPEFGITKFKEPTANSIYNAPVLFGSDSKGVLYGMVNNIYAADKVKRLPGVAKSTDNGVTWSEFDIMPWSIFDAYCKPKIEDGTPTDETDFGFAPFNGVDFQVLGENTFSYIAFVFSQSKTTDDYYVADIVEVYKENGNWGMRKIEDLRYRASETKRSVLSIPLLFEGGVAPVDGKIVYDFNTRRNELELAVTKDKQYIVAKWIDTKFRTDAEGLKIYDVDEDTLETSKVMYEQTKADGSTEWIEIDNKGYSPVAVYLKYRKIGEDNWSETVRLTNDQNYYLHTHMPDVIPSLTQIPMLVSTFMDDVVFDAEDSYFAIPTKQRNMIGNGYRNTMYKVFTTSAVEENNTTSSKEAVSVFPNPTNGEFTVKFNNATDNSTVEIFNTLGEKVMNVVGTTANASALSNGIYLVKVTNNGNVTSTLFTVAK